MFIPAHSLKSMLPNEAAIFCASLAHEVCSGLQHDSFCSGVQHAEELGLQEDCFCSRLLDIAFFSALPQQDETFSVVVPQHDALSSAAVKYTFKSLLLSTMRRSATQVSHWSCPIGQDWTHPQSLPS